MRCENLRCEPPSDTELGSPILGAHGPKALEEPPSFYFQRIKFGSTTSVSKGTIGYEGPAIVAGTQKHARKRMECWQPTVAVIVSSARSLDAGSEERQSR